MTSFGELTVSEPAGQEEPQDSEDSEAPIRDYLLWVMDQIMRIGEDGPFSVQSYWQSIANNPGKSAKNKQTYVTFSSKTRRKCQIFKIECLVPA